MRNPSVTSRVEQVSLQCFFLNMESEEESRMAFGSEFQRVGAAMEKALSPPGAWSGWRGAGGSHQQSGGCRWECVDAAAQGHIYQATEMDESSKLITQL